MAVKTLELEEAGEEVTRVTTVRRMAPRRVNMPTPARQTDKLVQPTKLTYHDATTAMQVEVALRALPGPLDPMRARDPRTLSVIATRFHMRDAPLREVTIAAAPLEAATRDMSSTSNTSRPLHSRASMVRIFATDAFAVGHAKREVARSLTDRGAVAISERGAWTLYLAPPDHDPVVTAFQLAHLARVRGALNAHPNFIRLVRRPTNAVATLPRLWNHAMIGVADTHRLRHGRGRRAIRVAILDEGVDDQHPALAAAVVASRDFIDGAHSAMPSGNDAHGTACAGVIASRDRSIPGIAPNVSLVAARIAKDDGAGNWVMDDFQTADAIEWCWKVARADVLSCSWRLGIPIDVVADALNDARARGRRGKGVIVVVAAGNDEGPIQFPGTLSGPLVVGASNGNDERKTRSSKDGEPHWGSSHGPTLSLLAPGIAIATTDISGARGHTSADFHDSFNGTSSATPHVAAAAAILVSIAPTLTETQVKRIVLRTARKLRKQVRWTPTEGHGRLDLHAAALQASTAAARKRKKNATLARAGKTRRRTAARKRSSSSKLT